MYTFQAASVTILFWSRQGHLKHDRFQPSPPAWDQCHILYISNINPTHFPGQEDTPTTPHLMMLAKANQGRSLWKVSYLSPCSSGELPPIPSPEWLDKHSSPAHPVCWSLWIGPLDWLWGLASGVYFMVVLYLASSSLSAALLMTSDSL